MYGVRDPFRLDQGDVSFDAPDTLKAAMRAAIDDNRTHYVQTTGLPRLLELLAEKLRRVNGTPVGSPDEVMVTNGGIHALYLVFQALLEPGDEVIIPDPEWPPCAGNLAAARAVAVPCPLHEIRGWRYDLDELESKITPRTRAIYINSPHNPTGGVLTPEDVEAIAAIVREHDLWLISDEAYEDVIFDDAQHVSPASLPGMYERTIPVYTFSKTYAITGLRLGYLAAHDAKLRERMKKVLFYTTSNVAVRRAARRDRRSRGVAGLRRGFPRGAAAAARLLLRQPDQRPRLATSSPARRPEARSMRSCASIRGGRRRLPPSSASSVSWAMAEHLISQGSIGCVPGADFGATGEGYIRFCFARDRASSGGRWSRCARCLLDQVRIQESEFRIQNSLTTV